jgi:anti-sigma factor RsiW
MTCSDAAERIDAFVDGELPPSASVELARHLGQCARCDRAVQGLLAVRDGIVAQSDRAIAALDFSRVWPHVDAAITRTQAQADWRERGAARRRVPRGLAVASLAAIAAGAMFFVRTATPPTGGPAIRVAQQNVRGTLVKDGGRRLPNHVLIDRLAGKDIALRREPKSGTTMIWVNHEVERSGW